MRQKIIAVQFRKLCIEQLHEVLPHKQFQTFAFVFLEAINSLFFDTLIVANVVEGAIYQILPI